MIKQGYIELKDFEFKLDESAYFDSNLINRLIEQKKKNDLSELSYVESERRITLPELPESVPFSAKTNDRVLELSSVSKP